MGFLGTPDFVRRHRFAALEGLAYLMLRTRDGDIDVAICLRETDFEMLRENGVWGCFAEMLVDGLGRKRMCEGIEFR